MLNDLKLLDLLGGAPINYVIVVVGVLLWRVTVHRDRKIDEDRARRFELTTGQIERLQADMTDLTKLIEQAATRRELHRVEGDLNNLQSDVRAGLAKLEGAVETLGARVVGQGEILSRIDEYLRRRDL